MSRDVKKGDELMVAFVDVTQHQGETAQECRRRRRARGWRFACGYQRCEEEGVGVTGELEQKDKLKVEGPVSRFEGREGAGDVV
jgi:import receptor subunit TOM20